MASVVSPPCGPECLRQRKLDALKLAMDDAYKNKEQNPVAYNDARMSYYTLLKGQSWLVSEKQKIAKEEIEPVIGTYSEAYKMLDAQKKSQGQFSKLASAVQSHEQDNSELQKELQKIQDKKNVAQRLSDIMTSQTNFTSYLPLILDIIVAVLGLVVVYMLYKYFTRPVETFLPEITGGRNSR